MSKDRPKDPEMFWFHTKLALLAFAFEIEDSGKWWFHLDIDSLSKIERWAKYSNAKKPDIIYSISWNGYINDKHRNYHALHALKKEHEPFTWQVYLGWHEPDEWNPKDFRVSTLMEVTEANLYP